MRTNDESGFKAALNAAFSVYKTELPEPAIAIWWAAMKPYGLGEMRAALEAHMTNPDSGQYFPKPADVIQIILDKEKKAKTKRCWNCQGDLAKLGSTKLRHDYVCNPCYADYMAGMWNPAKEGAA